MAYCSLVGNRHGKICKQYHIFLHDGRARNIEEAILWHGGEGDKAKEDFKKLPEVDRDALIKFVESL